MKISNAHMRAERRWSRPVWISFRPSSSNQAPEMASGTPCLGYFLLFHILIFGDTMWAWIPQFIVIIIVIDFSPDATSVCFTPVSARIPSVLPLTKCNNIGMSYPQIDLVSSPIFSQQIVSRACFASYSYHRPTFKSALKHPQVVGNWLLDVTKLLRNDQQLPWLVAICDGVDILMQIGKFRKCNYINRRFNYTIDSLI